MVTTIQSFKNSKKKHSYKIDVFLLATILVASVEISQVEAFTSLRLASRFLPHHSLPQYLIDLPPPERYITYGGENQDVDNDIGMIEEIPMRKSNTYVSRFSSNKI